MKTTPTQAGSTIWGKTIITDLGLNAAKQPHNVVSLTTDRHKVCLSRLCSSSGHGKESAKQEKGIKAWVFR